MHHPQRLSGIVLSVALLLCGVAVAGEQSSDRLNGKRLDQHRNQQRDTAPKDNNNRNNDRQHRRLDARSNQHTDRKQESRDDRNNTKHHRRYSRYEQRSNHNNYHRYDRFSHHDHYRSSPGYWRDFYRHSDRHHGGYRHRYYNGYNYYFNDHGFYFPAHGHIRHGHRHSHYCPDWHFEAFTSALLLSLIFD